MRRGLCFLLLPIGWAACGPDPLCGEDDEGNEIPICEYDSEEVGNLQYCPGEHWGANDGCNSCGCDPDGVVICTTATCGATGTEG